jgi:hypothetical protein
MRVQPPAGARDAAPANRDYFFLDFPACDSALAAADFEAALVRPSLITLDAALAAFGEVIFAGALVCESALPAVRDFAPVDLLVSVFDAFDAALPPVVFPLAMAISQIGWIPPQSEGVGSVTSLPTPYKRRYRARCAL